MAYITAEEVGVIRRDLKEAFPASDGWKFSVKLDGGHLGVSVCFMEGPVDLLAYDPCDEFRNPMADRDPTRVMSRDQINHFWINAHHPPETAAIFNKAHAIIALEHWDKSDMQSDRFHCAFYIHMGVGHYNKSYVRHDRPSDSLRA